MTNRALLAYRLDRYLALPPRRKQVARLYGEGLTMEEIGSRCCIQPGTVKQHLTAIYKALGFEPMMQHHHGRELAYLVGFVDGMHTNRLRIVMHKEMAA